MTRQSRLLAFLIAVIALAWIVLVAACALPNGGVINVERPGMVVHVEVSDAVDGHALAGAYVWYWYSGPDPAPVLQGAPCHTDARGTCQFIVPTSTTDSHMWVAAEGYLKQDRHVTAGPGIIIKWLLSKPPPPIVRKARDEVKAVETNFCNLRDGRGKVQFSPFIGGYPRVRQDDWIANEVKAGSTHFVVSVDVNGYASMADDEFHAVHFYRENRWEEFGDLLRRLRTAKLTPIIFLDSGDRYPGDEYFRGVTAWWQAHFADLTDQVVMVCAWETRRFGGYSAYQFDRANAIMREVLGKDAILAFHGSPESGLFGSHAPVEPDDPWQDDGEQENWYTHSGKEFEVLLFQTLYADNAALDEFGQPKWWNRTADTAERFLPLGTPLPGLARMKEGQNDGGWHYRTGYAHPDWFAGTKRERGRPVLVAFEYVAWGYIRGLLTDAQVTATADTLYAFGFRHFGNGAPRR
jgi:hypothetical protein